MFLFPWALIPEELGVFGLIAILLFMLTLIEGLFFAIKKGVLRWE
ncbi:MAG TPA: NADH-quinone oxidoreductase subunit A [Acidimicrobiia bacterium]|nr:NADH-quinone oxidoreductase subunit A [Acidimicrobiia bacterium]